MQSGSGLFADKIVTEIVVPTDIDHQIIGHFGEA